MLHEVFSLSDLHPDLADSPARLSVYARDPVGSVADSAPRWGVLILPGGGYGTVAPAEGEPVALAFLAAGMQAFVLEYSTLPTPWPRPLLEGAAAMAWLRGRAEEYGFRPDRVAVCGFSAGGHLAGSLCAYLAMAGLYNAFFPRISLISVSIAGAIVSNIARTGVAAAVMEAPSLFVQLPAVCAVSVAAGIIIGVLTTFSIKHLPERLTKFE